jgi:integrase
MNIATIWDQYKETLHNKPSQKVRQYYWNVLEKDFGSLAPSDVTEDSCKKYVAKRTESVSVSTAWGELSLLRTMLNWAVRKQLIRAFSYDVQLPTPNPPREGRLTREQFSLLLQSCAKPHTRLFVLLLISTACRASAALDLTWDRVDFKRRLVDLRSPYSAIRGRKGRAVVPMTDSLRTALLEAKEKASTQYVIEYAGQRVHDAYNGFKRAAVAAGLPWAHPHLIRHTAATWMAEADVPMSQIARYLGHNDSIITERVYAKYSPSYLRKASGALEVT